MMAARSRLRDAMCPLAPAVTAHLLHLQIGNVLILNKTMPAVQSVCVWKNLVHV
jgi:hypothetical protein